MDEIVPLGGYEVLEAASPADAPAGTIVSLEAWCYGENDEELGYFRLKRAWRASVANWAIFVHLPLPQNDREICLAGTEERGAVPCVSSGLLE